MEEKKEIKIKFTTLIIIILILVIIGLVTYIMYNPKSKEVVSSNNEVIKNEATENVIENTTENILETTNKEDGNEKETTTLKGEKFIQFDNEFYELKDVAKEYRLSENIKNYKDFNYDLDGDGVVDKITIQKNKENDGESYLFKLNGKEFAEHYSRPEIYIVDLNKNDNNIEVVIFDEGPSDDPNYTIYSKQGNKMVELINIGGGPLRTDKKGNIINGNFYNRKTSPEIYFDYYIINDNEIEREFIDIDKIKDVDFSTSLYFSEEYSNKENFWEITEDITDYKKMFKKANIEELDKDTTFKILKFETVKDDYGIEEYKIYVELSDGRKGYIFHIQLAG